MERVTVGGGGGMRRIPFIQADAKFTGLKIFPHSLQLWGTLYCSLAYSFFLFCLFSSCVFADISQFLSFSFSFPSPNPKLPSYFSALLFYFLISSYILNDSSVFFLFSLFLSPSCKSLTPHLSSFLPFSFHLLFLCVKFNHPQLFPSPSFSFSQHLAVEDVGC